MDSLRAIMICVEFGDLLALTLPYNRHHFDSVLIVTSGGDRETRQVAEDNDADVYVTDAFYRDGASFNKWKALEEGLDSMGRRGWLAILDADVLWPKDLNGWKPTAGCLHTPLRHMHVDLRQRFVHHEADRFGVHPYPPEARWWEFPTHRNIAEWAGYTQIFHANDPALGLAPWHEIDWKHAGGADSYFQAKWPLLKRLRPPWECLHLGPAGENWCGRASPRVDGTLPAESERRHTELQQFIKERKPGPDRHRHERL